MKKEKPAKLSKAQPDRVHPNKITLKDAVGYGLGDAGNLFVLTYVSSFLKVFLTDVLMIPATKAANLFLYTRLWDAVNDPMWGAVVAKKKGGKGGKYRPYILWLAVPLALSQLVCFINYGSYETKPAMVLTLAYVCYIAFGMLYTGVNVPFGSLASVITDDPDSRGFLSIARTIGAGIGGAAPLLIAPKIVYEEIIQPDKTVIQKARPAGFLWFAAAMAVLSIVFYAACYGNTKERISSPAEEKVDIKKVYGGMFKSPAFIILALSGLFISGQLQFASLNQYLYKNYFCNTDLSIYGTVAQYLPMVVMIPLTPKLSKKYGKKEISTVGAGVSALGAILTFVLRPGADSPWLYLGLLFVIGFGYSFVSITNWAVVADVIDWLEIKTGIKSASAVYAVYTFCRKLGQTAADTGGLKLLDKIGYNGKMEGYVPGVSPGIMKICTGIPAITYTAIFILYLIFPLTKKKLEKELYPVMELKNDE